ncbi:OmpH family outer membrane protein [Pollutibacter soli]|uniref:OmpH family outer membrane protein n=1 Tax=Pollutibacter soli TaxID=3034157 RepID=UPI0030132B1F
MKRVAFLAVMMMGLFSASQLSAQTKTAFISVDEVVQLMPEYKKAMADMAQFDSSLQINYASTVQELNRLDSTIKADSLKWSPAVKNAQKDKMKKLLVDLQGYEQSYQQQMQQKQEELLTPVAQKANSLISDVAKTNGFTYVFRKEALLVFPDGDDLLPLVKKKLGVATTAPKPAGVK